MPFKGAIQLDHTDQAWQEEQRRVEYVADQIDARIRKLEREVGSVRGDVVEMRKDFWDEVTVNFSEADDVGETSTSLRQQSQVLAEREKSHQHASIALGKMKRLKQSPYFGRIDFAEDGEPEEAIYLGIASLLEEGMKRSSFMIGVRPSQTSIMTVYLGRLPMKRHPARSRGRCR